MIDKVRKTWKIVAEASAPFLWAAVFLLLTRTVYVHYLYRVEWMNFLYATLSKVVTAGAVCLFVHALFSGKRPKAGVLVLLLFLFLWQLGATTLGNGSLRRTVRIFYPMLGMGCFLSVLCVDGKRTARFIGATADLLLTLSMLNFALALLFPDLYAVENSFMDAYLLGSENQISLSLLVGVFFCFLDQIYNGNAFKKRIALLLYFAFSLWIRSASGLLAAAAVAVMLLPFIKRRLEKYSLFALTVGVTALGFVGVLTGVFGGFRFPPIAFLLRQLFDKDPTLTGRTEIWKQALEGIFHSPLFGCGVGESGDVFYISLFVEGVGRVRGYMSAHNQFLQAAYEGGFPVIAIFLLVVYTTSRLLTGSGKEALSWAFKTTLIAFIVVLFAEAASFDGVFFLLQFASLLGNSGKIPLLRRNNEENLQNFFKRALYIL